MSSHNNSQYAEKDDSYYGLIREEILNLIPSSTKRLLDIGCGMGTISSIAKKKFNIKEVIGIEKFENAASVASTKLDKVICGDIESIQLEYSNNYFDCILCADVFEHLINPENVVRKLHHLLSDNGVMITSLPNIRHIVPLLKIIFDRLEYEESGILDKTHLHFYTLHTMKKMFLETGFEIQRIENNRSRSLKFKIANIITLGLFKPFSIYQYIFVLKKM
ncbi:MAG: class I SAM-dependent methyltransferase [Melioribacter sp.]|nr:class I SAM-dependent methyltransferase [Melioribacter sp.]